jgi:hypothetical protein
MLKFKSARGQYIITYNEKEFIFPTLHDALEYIFYHRFMALVSGKKIGYHNDTLYPVNSLTPPTVVRIAKFFDLGIEIC